MKMTNAKYGFMRSDWAYFLLDGKKWRIMTKNGFVIFIDICIAKEKVCTTMSDDSDMPPAKRVRSG